MVLGRKKKEEKPSQNLQQPIAYAKDSKSEDVKPPKDRKARKVSGRPEIQTTSKSRQVISPAVEQPKEKRSLLQLLGIKKPEPQIKDEKITWEEFVKMFFEGRTHTLYGQILNIFLAIFLIVLFRASSNPLLFIVPLLILIVAVGSAVDITAHLWYH
ncbi:MAG: hypothetical protein AMDU2_EPLC00006G0074 [Thermoplasmatales archaeon E-plasma]|nr:MAG: hypothetical protein AMDU2_EPLC00006G0074 [Thermoplasmatales archaeon E-plasma]